MDSRVLGKCHRLKHRHKKCSLAVGDVAIIESSERNKKLLIEGRDGAVCDVSLRTGQSHIECPIQHLYPLELLCNRKDDRRNAMTFDPGATAFRPRQNTAVTARI